MLSIFSCPSVCLLWWNVYLDILPILWLFIFLYWAVGTVCVVWRLIPCQFFETKSIRRAVFVCFRFGVRKGWWSVAMIWTQLCVLILHPHVVLYAWSLPVSFIHKNVSIRFAQHVLLLSMYVLLRNRSLLCPGYNCKHRGVVPIVILISTRLSPYFQLDYKQGLQSLRADNSVLLVLILPGKETN